MCSRLTTVLVICWLVAVAAPTLAQTLPTLPSCTDNGADHERWAMKTRAKPDVMPASGPQEITVMNMLNWRVPTNLEAADRDSDQPVTRLEQLGRVYALTGFVRLVKLQADCDFHIQVAASQADDADQVVVEIPRGPVQRQVMGLMGVGNRRKSTKRK